MTKLINERMREARRRARRRALTWLAVGVVLGAGGVALGYGVADAAGQAPAERDPNLVLAEKLRDQLYKERDLAATKVRKAYRAGYNRAVRTKVFRQPGIKRMIRTVAISYGIPPDQHVARARCESLLRPGVVNPASGVGGLFQFEQSTWTGFTRVGRAGLSRFDALANTLGAAEMISRGLSSHWDCNAQGVPKSRGGRPG